MPRIINYDSMSYTKKESTGEHVRTRAFYESSLPENRHKMSESPDIFRGPENNNYFGLEFYDDDDDDSNAPKGNSNNSTSIDER